MLQNLVLFSKHEQIDRRFDVEMRIMVSVFTDILARFMKKFKSRNSQISIDGTPAYL